MTSMGFFCFFSLRTPPHFLDSGVSFERCPSPWRCDMTSTDPLRGFPSFHVHETQGYREGSGPGKNRTWKGYVTLPERKEDSSPRLNQVFDREFGTLCLLPSSSYPSLFSFPSTHSVVFYHPPLIYIRERERDRGCVCVCMCKWV